MIRLVRMLCLAAALWPASLLAQIVSGHVVVGSSVSTRSGSVLGLKYTHQSGGLTLGVAAQNVTNLNNWGGTGATGWKADRYRLDLQGRVALAGTVPWTLPAIDGVRILTNGVGTPRAETEYTTINASTGSVTGGMPTSFVWIDSANKTGPAIVLSGYGGEMGNFRIDGNVGFGNFTSLVADAVDRKAIGVMLRDDKFGYGVGKYKFDSFTPNFCVVGMAVVSPTVYSPVPPGNPPLDPTLENGDETTIQIFKPEYCDVGFLSQHNQCLGMMFGYCAQLNQPVMWRYEKGGDLHVRYLVALGSAALKGLEVTGNDGNTSGVFEIDHVQIDANANTDYHVIHVEPTSGSSAFSTRVNFLNNAKENTTGAMLWLKNNYGLHWIRGGECLPTGFIHVEGGLVNAFPTVLIYGARWRIGADMDNIRNLFDATSRDYVQVVFRDNTEQHGIDSGPDPVNAGRFYTDFKGLIDINTDTTYDLVP